MALGARVYEYQITQRLARNVFIHPSTDTDRYFSLSSMRCLYLLSCYQINILMLHSILVTQYGVAMISMMEIHYLLVDDQKLVN